MYKYEFCYIFQRCVVVSISFTVLWNFKCSDFNQFDVPVKRNYICINRIIWFTQKHFSFRNICLVCRENKKNLKLSLSLISILCCSCTPSYHGWWPTWRTSEQCSVHRSITVALLVQYCVCYWKCSCVVVVLQKRVSTDSFQPIFSLVVGSRLFSWACDRPCVDSYQIFYWAPVFKRFARININVVDLHNRRHHFQHLLCFCRPIHCHKKKIK